jgi:WD40 repeat protein
VKFGAIQLDTSFYVTGGTLSRDALCYVTRQADHQLYDHVSNGDFCYVLTARQMGKSSLMVRTASRLRDEGVGVTVLDLTAIGQNLTAEQWYNGLLIQMAQQLALEEQLEAFWDSRSNLGPLQRWMQALRQVVLQHYPGRVVIFIDEIDVVRSLPFSTDEFFAGLREFYNRRTEDPDLVRLSFCLLGVAAPSDLIRDTRMTPFNIGQRIELYDFTEAESQVLAFPLGGGDEEGAALLRRILNWTAGHPYLTQRLCQAVSRSNPQSAIRNPQSVDGLCAELFFTRRAKEQDDNLLFVRERMLRSELELAELLQLYAQVHRGKPVEDDETNPFVTILKLSGIARIEDGRLRVRNPIYERVFDQNWIATNMPDAEVRRQRAAYRKGLLRAAAIAAVILVAIASLAFVAVRQRNLARAAEETNRKQLYAAQMNLAAQAWEEAGVSRMLDLLDNQTPKPGQEDLRGFEWYHLWGLGHGDLRSFHHGDSVVPVKFFPDNRRVATGGSDHLVRVWDVITGEQLMALSGHSEMIWSVAVSPDGQTLASASADKTARVWNAVTGKEITMLQGHTDDIGVVDFAPDGKKLATASSDKTVKLWDAVTFRELVTVSQPSDQPTIAFSPDSKTIATGGFDGIARLWDTTTGRELRTFKGGIAGPIFTLAFSPDGAILVTGGGHSCAQFWNVATGDVIPAIGSTSDQKASPKIIRLSNAVLSVSFSPDGATLALASYDRTVRLYTTDTLQLVNTFKGHDLSAESVIFSPNGRLLATAGRDGVVKLWDAGVAQEPELPGKRLGMVFSMAFSPIGCCVATTGLDQQVPKLWDVKTQRELMSFTGHAGDAQAVTFSPDGRRLATGGRDKTVRVWDVATGRELLNLKGHTEHIQDVAFSPDGRYLASGSWDKTVKIWDTATGEELASFLIPSSGRTDTPLSVMFSPDGQFLATGSDDNTVRLWDITARQESITLTQPKEVSAVCFSPDGKTLAAGLGDGQVKLWDLSTAKEVSTLKGHVSHVSRLAFFPDGQRLLSGGGGDNTVKIWNAATGQELISFKHNNQITGVAVSPDGRIIASGSNNIRLRFAVDPATFEESKTQRLRSLVANTE